MHGYYIVQDAVRNHFGMHTPAERRELRNQLSEVTYAATWLMLVAMVGANQLGYACQNAVVRRVLSYVVPVHKCTLHSPSHARLVREKQERQNRGSGWRKNHQSILRRRLTCRGPMMTVYTARCRLDGRGCAPLFFISLSSFLFFLLFFLVRVPSCLEHLVTCEKTSSFTLQKKQNTFFLL